MRNKKDNLAYVAHIHDAIAKIVEYTSNRSYDDYLQSDWDRDAIIRNLEIIGEAASNIEEEFKKNYPAIEWRKTF
jgi:uncharacterized protein with HEPN domain